MWVRFGNSIFSVDDVREVQWDTEDNSLKFHDHSNPPGIAIRLQHLNTGQFFLDLFRVAIHRKASVLEVKEGYLEEEGLEVLDYKLWFEDFIEPEHGSMGIIPEDEFKEDAGFQAVLQDLDGYYTIESIKWDEYPAWICRDCAESHGGSWPAGHVATFHSGVCGWCSQQASVTEPRDWRYPLPPKKVIKGGPKVYTTGPREYKSGESESGVEPEGVGDT